MKGRLTLESSFGKGKEKSAEQKEQQGSHLIHLHFA